jgi:hypothetical protein
MAACDPTTISGATYYTDADSALVQDPYRYFAKSTQGYDFHLGRLFGHCTACFEVANVRGSDAYRIQGAPAGVPIPLHIDFRIDIYAGGSLGQCGIQCNNTFKEAKASIYSSQSGDSSTYCFCGGAITKSIGLDLQVVPDEDFVVGYFVGEWVGFDGFADSGRVEANIHFNGVPTGAQLVSCHGVNDEVVAAKPSTWGHLKATYR